MSIVNKNEIRRLEKAAREKDKKHLDAWAKDFERQITIELKRQYDENFLEDITSFNNNILLALAYTLHFSEETNYSSSKMKSFIDDFYTTIDMFRTKEYTPNDYTKILEQDNILPKAYDYMGVYKKYLKIYDDDLVMFLRNPQRRKIMTICASIKYKNEVMDIYKEYTLKNYLVFYDALFNVERKAEIDEWDVMVIQQTTFDKILLSDVVYVYNKDGYIDEIVKSCIEYAKKHNKEIIYLEDIENKGE